ncbi:MAG: TIM barrel protein, partial [Alphaproteobacteria bacterium]|nr:TIM barrel protein [Alphaproteobacteria bacterium]
TRRALEAIGSRPGFALNFDPSHFVHQFLDPAAFALEFPDRIAHVHIKDAKLRLDGRRSILGSHLDFDAADRGWTFVSPGRGDVDFDAVIRALNRIDYTGPLSVEWEDAEMDREWGAQEAVEFVRKIDFPRSGGMFDTAFRS